MIQIAPPFKHVHHLYIDEKHIPYDTRQVEGMGWAGADDLAVFLWSLEKMLKGKC